MTELNELSNTTSTPETTTAPDTSLDEFLALLESDAPDAEARILDAIARTEATNLAEAA